MAQVFEDTRHLVQSAVDGYNVCIFAYGQTGAASMRSRQHTLAAYLWPFSLAARHKSPVYVKMRAPHGTMPQLHI